jgi:hypothetical protein
MSPRSVRDVYRFYAEQAHRADWTPWQKLSYGLKVEVDERTSHRVEVG